MKRRKGFVAVTLVAIAAAVAAAVALGGSSAGSTKDRALSRVSNVGSRIGVTKRTRVQFQKSGLGGTVYNLGTEGDRTFYRFDDTAHGTCYGVGPAAASGGGLGVISCSTAAFPSADQPVIDLSIVEIVRGSDDVHVWRAEGLAADGVATIGFVDASGAVIAKHHVVKNLFHFPNAPSGAVAGLVGLDKSGATVFSLSYARG